MISIIVPVYNIESYVRYCIESILQQDFADWELILVNDGSTDSSGEICREYSLADRRIKAIDKENGGQSSARNAGLDIVNGDWIIFVDGDDYLNQHTLSTLYNMASIMPSDVDIVQYGYQETNKYISDDVAEETPIISKEIVRDNAAFFEHLLAIGGEAASPCTKLIKASLLKDLRFVEGIIMEDEQFTTHLLLRASAVCYTDYRPYMYVHRPNSTTSSRFNHRRLAIIDILKERIDLLKSLKLNDISEQFRLKLIRNIFIMYMAAAAVSDYASCKVLSKDVTEQLRLLRVPRQSLSKTENIKYALTKAGLPILRFESIIRRILNKQIRYE